MYVKRGSNVVVFCSILASLIVVIPRPKSSLTVKRSVKRSSVRKLKLLTLCSFSAPANKAIQNCFRKLNCSIATENLVVAQPIRTQHWQYTTCWIFLIWDKQHETHIVRKSILRLWQVWSLVSIGPYIEQDTAIYKREIYKRLEMFWSANSQYNGQE